MWRSSNAIWNRGASLLAPTFHPRTKKGMGGRLLRFCRFGEVPGLRWPDPDGLVEVLDKLFRVSAPGTCNVHGQENTFSRLDGLVRGGEVEGAAQAHPTCFIRSPPARKARGSIFGGLGRRQRPPPSEAFPKELVRSGRDGRGLSRPRCSRLLGHMSCSKTASLAGPCHLNPSCGPASHVSTVAYPSPPSCLAKWRHAKELHTLCVRENPTHVSHSAGGPLSSLQG